MTESLIRSRYFAGARRRLYARPGMFAVSWNTGTIAGGLVAR
jgi:hypothetical protein